MNGMVLLSIWYGVLMTLPPIVIRLLIKHASVRVGTHRQPVPSIRRRRYEV